MGGIRPRPKPMESDTTATNSAQRQRGVCKAALRPCVICIMHVSRARLHPPQLAQRDHTITHLLDLRQEQTQHANAVEARGSAVVKHEHGARANVTQEM